MNIPSKIEKNKINPFPDLATQLDTNDVPQERPFSQIPLQKCRQERILRCQL